MKSVWNIVHLDRLRIKALRLGPQVWWKIQFLLIKVSQKLERIKTMDKWFQQVFKKASQAIPSIISLARLISSGVWGTRHRAWLRIAILARAAPRPTRNRCQKKRNWDLCATGLLKKREALVTHPTSKKIKLVLLATEVKIKKIKRRTSQFWASCGVGLGLANCPSGRQNR